MSTIHDQPSSAAGLMKGFSETIDANAAADSLKYGPRGAVILAGIAAGLLFVGWLAFYFLLFLPRGSIG